MTDSAKEAVVYTFKTPVRAGFLNVINARKFKENGKEKGEPRYDASFILAPDSADLAALKSLCVAMAKAQFPNKRLVARRLTQEEVDAGDFVEVNMPWRDGTKDADKAKADSKDQEFARGKIIVKAASKYAPALAGIENGKVVSYTDPSTRATLEKFFYPGAHLVPFVQLHSYPARDQKPGGVGLWLNSLCFVKNDARLTGGGGVNAAEVFKQYAGTTSAVDPTSEMDDEIPF